MTNLANYQTMDPMILLSIVNMQLRDYFASLEALCQQHEIDQQQLCDRLAKVGFSYQTAQNQFK